jgi:hypothetical protein
MDPAAFDDVAGGSWDEESLADDDAAGRLVSPVAMPTAVAPKAVQAWRITA